MASANAGAPRQYLQGKWWHGLSLEQRLDGQLHQRKVARSVLRTLDAHPRLALDERRTSERSEREARHMLRVLKRELPETREALREAADYGNQPDSGTYAATPAPAAVSLSADWLYNAFLCIHSYEGAWTANTGNGYYGGLQMDYSFMSSYGPELLASKGTANNWTPDEQIMVAIRAYNSGRGFYPWPNTARLCGLI